MLSLYAPLFEDFAPCVPIAFGTLQKAEGAGQKAMSDAPLPDHMSRNSVAPPIWTHVIGGPIQRAEQYKRQRFDAVSTSPESAAAAAAAGCWFGFKPKQTPTLMTPPPYIPTLPTIEEAAPLRAAVCEDSDASLGISDYDESDVEGDVTDDDGAQKQFAAPVPAPDVVASPGDCLSEDEDEPAHADMQRFAVAMYRITQRSARERAERYNTLFDPFCRAGLPPLPDRPEFEANISAAIDTDMYRRIEAALKAHELDAEVAERLQAMSTRTVRARAFVLSNHARRQLTVSAVHIVRDAFAVVCSRCECSVLPLSEL